MWILRKREGHLGSRTPQRPKSDCFLAGCTPQIHPTLSPGFSFQIVCVRAGSPRSDDLGCPRAVVVRTIIVPTLQFPSEVS